MATLLGGGILLAAFFLVEARSYNSMLSLALFRSRNFAGANLPAIFLYMALAGAIFFFPLRLIRIQGYSAPAPGAAAWVPFISHHLFPCTARGCLDEKTRARNSVGNRADYHRSRLCAFVDRRLARIELPIPARSAMDQQRARLAGARNTF